MFDEEAGGVQCKYAPEGDAVMGGFGGVVGLLNSSYFIYMNYSAMKE